MMRLRRNRDVVLRMQRRFREHIERPYGRPERHEAERQEDSPVDLRQFQPQSSPIVCKPVNPVFFFKNFTSW